MVSDKMKALLEGMKSARSQAKKQLPIEQQRADLERYVSHLKVPEGVLIDDFLLAGRPARKYFTPKVREDATVLYLHGGGYCVGSLDSHHSFMAHLAVACETSINGLDYRLAPENPFPAALDDAVAAYKEMLEYTNGSKIMIAGDSAGGGLALACALRLKDENVAMPGCLALLSPWTDLTCSGESLRDVRDQFVLNATHYASAYALDTVGLSPLFGDLSGLPPLLIQVVSDEKLVDDSRRLQALARQSDVSVDMEVIDKAFHVFQIFTDLPESHAALAAVGRFYNAHI